MGVTLDLVNSLLDGPTGRRDEKQILTLLREAPGAELNDVLENVDAAKLFDDMDDRLIGPDNATALIELLTRTRRHELSMAAQVAVIHGMQGGATSAAMEGAIRDMLLAHTGNDLTHLKNTLNLAKGRHDLEGLVFADIDDDAIRAEILDHFAASSSLEGERQAKTLSDIDDTALAKIHETRYPRGTVIPGIIAFYEALDLGPRDAPLSRGDLTFVTARPADALGLMKSYSRESLTKAGFADLSIMTGSIFHLATHDAMAAKKVANIAHYATLFPEYDLVFVGDSGQGDIAVGEQILQAHGDVVKAVFIHDVVALDAGRRAELAAKGIWVVDTYVGAAAKAHELGLISEAGVQRVIDETHRLLDDVEWGSSEQERAMRELVERDASGR
ncbi:DUF2183 domain-containing protein [Dermacoccus nishinomiyaensis]|uniref:phosphatase domain-containing protein n=2 Tax=Dermacoccus TaxID=57495 RepID=UPI0010ABB3D4|nr:phosphatase domain-containing protein [Dermacoccus nishinomiyaensis]TJZ95381.1 DUF2183 domain-containing protein [Dermacoccus nishinomiyaensis]